jgi:hypothetical protein
MANDIPTGLRVPSQVPLDSKAFSLNQTILSNLGVNNNLAFTYFEGLEVTCIQERTKWEWKEVEPGDTLLIGSSFTYPSNWIVEGIDYSNRIFNFVKVETIVPPPVDQNNYVRNLYINQADLEIDEETGKPTLSSINQYINDLPAGDKTLSKDESKWNIVIYTSNPT